MHEPYSTITLTAELILLVGAVTAWLYRSITYRTACALLTLSSVLAVVRDYLDNSWPWMLLSLLSVAVLVLAWARYPNKGKQTRA